MNRCGYAATTRATAPRWYAKHQGIETMLKDDSGNVFSMTQPTR